MADDDATIDLTRPMIEPSGARIIAEMRHYVACPACGEKAGRIDHLYSDVAKRSYRGRSQSVGPWVCDDCGAGYRVTVTYEDHWPALKPGNIVPRVAVERDPAYDHVDTLTMLYFPVTDAGRLIVSSRRLASDKVGYGQRYFYDEHTCTLNLLQGNVELVIDDDDTDPHGLFVYVTTIDWPDDLDLDALSAREIRALFEAAPMYGGDDSATLSDDDGLEFAPEPPPLVFDLQPSGLYTLRRG